MSKLSVLRCREPAASHRVIGHVRAVWLASCLWLMQMVAISSMDGVEGLPYSRGPLNEEVSYAEGLNRVVRYTIGVGVMGPDGELLRGYHNGDIGAGAVDPEEIIQRAQESFNQYGVLHWVDSGSQLGYLNGEWYTPWYQSGETFPYGISSLLDGYYHVGQHTPVDQIGFASFDVTGMPMILPSGAILKWIENVYGYGVVAVSIADCSNGLQLPLFEEVFDGNARSMLRYVSTGNVLSYRGDSINLGVHEGVSQRSGWMGGDIDVTWAINQLRQRNPSLSKVVVYFRNIGSDGSVVGVGDSWMMAYEPGVYPDYFGALLPPMRFWELQGADRERRMAEARFEVSGSLYYSTNRIMESTEHHIEARVVSGPHAGLSTPVGLRYSQRVMKRVVVDGTQSAVVSFEEYGFGVSLQGDGQIGVDVVELRTRDGFLAARREVVWEDPRMVAVDDLPSEPGYGQCPRPTAEITPLTSRVENPQLSHIHTATDSQPAGGAAGCGPCGASTGGGGGLTTDIRLDRIHRYADFTRPGSFGPGVFSNLDIGLTLWNHGESGEIWDPSAASPIPLTRTDLGRYADQKRSAIASLVLHAADGTTVVEADAAVTATATQHDGTTWIFELVQAGLGGDADRQGRLVAIRDRAANQVTIAYAFPADATDAVLGARSRLLEMATATDQRGRQLSFAYAWSCGQPVISTLTYPTGAQVVYHYDGDIAGVCAIDYPDGTHSTFALRADAASQCMVVDYQDAGAEGTHRTKSVFLTKTAYTQADGVVVAQSPNRVRRVVGPTGEPTYLNWLERDGAQVKIFVFEGGGIAGKGRMLRLDTTEGVTDATWVASAWSFATEPSTWTWEKIADYEADSRFRMGAQTDPLGKSTTYLRDPASGAITGREHRNASGAVVSSESTVYNAMRLPTRHQDANGLITRSTYDDQGNLRFRTEGIVFKPDGLTEDASTAVTWEWRYRTDGQVIQEIDPLGRVTDYEYDSRGFRTAEVSPPDDPLLPAIRARKQWHYDVAGRLEWSKDAANHTTQYVYDDRNRVQEVRYGNGSKERYDYGTGADANLLLSKTDRDGMVTSFVYDAAGRETSRIEGAQNPAIAITTTTSYLDGTDLPQVVTRAGQKTEYVYDTRKRVVETRRWVDGSRYLTDSTVFDAADRVAYTQDAFGRRTFSVYDDLDRVIRTVREAIPGGVPSDSAVPTPDELRALVRVATTNPVYIIDETGYDAGGRVLTTTDARGIVTKMAYDRLSRLTDRWEAFDTPDEGHWQWTYDDAGNRKTEIDPLGHVTTWTYTGRNLVASQMVATDTLDEATVSFTYTLTGQRATQTDANDHTVQWIYGNCCDWLEDVIDAAGFMTHYTYTPGGLTETVRDANLNVTRTLYDGLKRPSVVTNGDNEVTTTLYDDNLLDAVGLSSTYATEFARIANRTGHRAVAVRNHLQETTVQVSDGLGRTVLVIDAERHVTQTIHDQQVNLSGASLVGTTLVDPLGNRTNRYADGLGRLRIIEPPAVVLLPPAGETADYSLYDGEGIDAEYDLSYLGDLSSATATKTVDASGYTTIQVEGIVSSTTTYLGPFGGSGGDGNWYSMTDWDLIDGMDVDADYLSELENAGFYDRAGMWADKETDGDGWVTLIVHQQTTSSEVLGPYAPQTLSGRIVMGYDANGNRRTVTDPLGHTQSSCFDARNRQVNTTDATGNTSSIEYDLLGNVLRHVDGFNHATEFTYTARNQKKTEKDRLGNTTAFSYDLAGNLLTISDAENEAKKATVTPEVYEAGKTRYAYTERNQLETETFPGTTGGTRSYTYHPNGQLWTRTDQRGIVTTYTYDGANRLTARAYSDAPADTFDLDDAGRIETATSGRYGTVVERTWKPTGLIETETMIWPADISGVTSSTLVQYGYDAANRGTTVTYPGGATLVREFTTRNQLDRLTLDGTQLAQAGYDNAGRRTSLLYGNGLTDTRAYTDDNRLESTVVGFDAPALPVLSLGYQYDENRRKTTETDGVIATRGQHFGYDDADRLTAWNRGVAPATTGPGTQSWTLTPVGDWKQTIRDDTPENREHTAVHEIAKINDVLVLHDAAGNLARTAQGQGFSWDAENRLLMADALPSDDYKLGQVFYWYDALGRRVAKRVHGSVTRYVHDGWQVIQELDAPVIATPAEAASDGPLTNLATVPDGALLYPTFDAEGNRHDPVRVNFQPETTAIPDGFIADKGRVYDTRTNGLSYGWLGDTGRPSPTARRFHPLPQYDTFGLVAEASTTWTWQIALPNGTYPVAIVAGDATSLAHTNNFVVNGQTLTDPDPGNASTVPAYEDGDFDGWLVSVQVTDGVLTITAGAGAFDPSMTHVEIGAQGQAITPEMQTRLADQILAATQRTGGSPFWNGGRTEIRSYVWDPHYVDGLVAYQRTNEAGTQTYYAHSGAQYSVQAVTSETGQVVERYSYTAYGERVVEGVSNGGRSSIGLTTAFTGRELDEETGLYYFRNRMYSGKDGRFVSRDSMGYVDGYSMYSGYFVPTFMDPMGTILVAIDGTDSKKDVTDKFPAEADRERHSSILKFHNRYQMGIEGPAMFWDGPSWTLTGYDSRSIESDAYRWLKVAVRNNPGRPIDLVGLSRGGFIVMNIARKIASDPEFIGCNQVRFLGLLDAVDMAPGYGLGDGVSSNVRYAASVLSAEEVGSRSYFRRVGQYADDGSQTNFNSIVVFGTHAAIGGDPWEGDHPAHIGSTRPAPGITRPGRDDYQVYVPNITQDQDRQASIVAWDYLVRQARIAGVHIRD